MFGSDSNGGRIFQTQVKSRIGGEWRRCANSFLTRGHFFRSIFKLEQKYKFKSHVAAKEWKKISAKYFSDHLILIKMFLVSGESRRRCGRFAITINLLVGSSRCRRREARKRILRRVLPVAVDVGAGEHDQVEYRRPFASDGHRENSRGERHARFERELERVGFREGGSRWRIVSEFDIRRSNEQQTVFEVFEAFVVLASGRARCNIYRNCSKSKNEVLLHPLSTLLDYSHLPSNQTTLLTQNDVVQYLPTDWLVCNEFDNAFSDEVHTASICTAVTPTTLALFAGSYKICSTPQNQKTGWCEGSDNSVSLVCCNVGSHFSAFDSKRHHGSRRKRQRK